MDDSRRYETTRQTIGVVEFALNAIVLIAALKLHWTGTIRDLATTWFPHSSAGIVFGYAAVLGVVFTVLHFPFEWLSGYWLENRFGLSRQSMGAWLKDWLKGLALSAVFGLSGIELVYLLLRHYPAAWWMYAAVLFIGFFVALSNLAPVLLLPLFFKFIPVENVDLQRRVDRLAEKTGARVCGLFEWVLSEKTRKANAAVVGWGNTRRIIVSDTLLQNFSGEELEVIMAHELCHHVKAHIWLGMILQSALTFVSFFAVDRMLRFFQPHFHGVADIANFPVLSLTVMALTLLVLPGANCFSRWLEKQADLYALEITGDSLAFVSSMEKLADLNLANRSPNPVIEFLFYSHPSIEHRIELAAAYADYTDWKSV